ncbi:MAG: sugar ABC transporter permease [Anaerolineales bacterium]|nr:sugar ABC transporter permease [Anaerolineales bacterium]MCB8959993.1 sugar ABC transporter permease [Ardenticatenales bacterium]MCB0006395.1 sugar ABC transporter permease [Anaerolineales bacterium]MCB0013145.1 sugar ABC transporter permease [Anaerolineales bacterium]MCB0017325.1 sugar ABC transporter permease [Anaerolineales bacterium]
MDSSITPVSGANAQAAQHSRTIRRRRDNLAGYLFISPWLIGFLVFTLLPLLGSLYLAFTDYNLTSTPQWIGVENFQRMFFDDVRYWKSVKATFFYVFTAVPARLVFALAVAMLLNNSRKGISFYRAAYYAPSIIGGSVAVALMWRRIFASDGLVNAVLALIGIPYTRAWIGRPETAIWTLILLAVWQFGSPMLIFLAGLRQIPEALYESASIDGATPWRKFVYITLPMLSPVIFFNLIMQLISGFLVFTQALIITNGGPLDTTLFYALYLYQRAFVTFQMGYGTAMAWVLLLIVGLFTAITFKTSSSWVFYEDQG